MDLKLLEELQLKHHVLGLQNALSKAHQSGKLPHGSEFSLKIPIPNGELRELHIVDGVEIGCDLSRPFEIAKVLDPLGKTDAGGGQSTEQIAA